jgi:hypothetical protein
LIYVLYRWIIAIFFMFSIFNSVIYSIANDKTIAIFIYLTRWNLYQTTIAMTIGAFLVTRHYFKNEKNFKMTKSIKIYWIISNNSVVFACSVSIINWTLLHKYGTPIDLNNVLVHITNSMVLIIDLFIIQHPHRTLHLIYPVMSGLVYLAFSIVFPFLGGLNEKGESFIYSILDWKNKPKSAAIVSIGCIVLLTIIHLILKLFHVIRNQIHKIKISDPRTSSLFNDVVEVQVMVP